MVIEFRRAFGSQGETAWRSGMEALSAIVRLNRKRLPVFVCKTRHIGASFFALEQHHHLCTNIHTLPCALRHVQIWIGPEAHAWATAPRLARALLRGPSDCTPIIDPLLPMQIWSTARTPPSPRVLLPRGGVGGVRGDAEEQCPAWPQANRPNRLIFGLTFHNLRRASLCAWARRRRLDVSLQEVSPHNWSAEKVATLHLHTMPKSQCGPHSFCYRGMSVFL